MSLDYKHFPLVDFYNRKVRVQLPEGFMHGVLLPDRESLQLMILDGSRIGIRREDILGISLVN